MSEKTTVGSRIRSFRERLDMTVSDLAQKSGVIMRRAKGYEKHPERLKLINHATGHRPPRSATEEGYRFLDRHLKNL